MNRKLFILIHSILLCVFMINPKIIAQDVEAKLSTDDNTTGFTVKDVNDLTLFDIRGNGNIGIGGVSNTDYLLRVGMESWLTNYSSGRSILLQGELLDGSGNAGSVILKGGLAFSGLQAFGAILEINGGSNGVGGGIKLITGEGEESGGDILLKTGNTSSSGIRAGNVEIKTGVDYEPTSIPSGGNFSVNCGWGHDIGGSISLNAGSSVGSEGAGGNIGLYAGTGYSGSGGNVSIAAGNGYSIPGVPGELSLYGGSSNGLGGNINLTPGNDDGGTNHGIVEVTGSGTVSGDWTVASDKRYKKNIKDLNEPIENILELRPVKYELRVGEFPEKHFEVGERIGLIAQEVEELFPKLVKTDKAGFQSVDYTKISVLLLQVVKKQHDINNKQQNEIDDLKQQVKYLLENTNHLALEVTDE